MSSPTLPPTRREVAERTLRAEIVSGQLPPGTVIKDAEVAARLGLSITPVREAITHLAAEGLIDIAPNKARRVTPVTMKNALELIDTMGVLAGTGFAWGAPNLTAYHRDQMRARLEEMRVALAAGDLLRATAVGREFSTVAIMAAGNRELQSLVDLVVARTSRLHNVVADDGVWALWVDGYSEVLRHLDADDVDAAVTRYREIYVHYRAHVETLAFD